MARSRRLDLAGAIMAGLSSAMRLASMSKPITGVPLPREGDGDRQTDIAEPDDGELSTVRHE